MNMAWIGGWGGRLSAALGLGRDEPTRLTGLSKINLLCWDIGDWWSAELLNGSFCQIYSRWQRPVAAGTVVLNRISLFQTDWPRDKSCHRACMRGVFFGLSLFETWHLCEWHWLWKSGSERLTFHFSRRQTCVRNARLAGVYFVSAVCISVLFILLLQNLQIIVLIPPPKLRQFRSNSIDQMVWVITWFSSIIQQYIYVLCSFFYCCICDICMIVLKDILNYRLTFL